jgi:hypothetical protein
MLVPDPHKHIMNTIRNRNNDFRIGVESGTIVEAESRNGPGDTLKVGSQI